MVELRKVGKRGQEEMVGFVLIVVLVMIAAMIFLVISVRKGKEDVRDSVVVENMLNTIMRHTTDCAITFEPQYDTIEDLAKSCYESERCSNLGNSLACDYLNETLSDIMEDLVKGDSFVSAYELDITHKASVGDDPEAEGDELLRIFGGGNCTEKGSTVSGALRLINLASSGDIAVRLRVCRAF